MSFGSVWFGFMMCLRFDVLHHLFQCTGWHPSRKGSGGNLMIIWRQFVCVRFLKLREGDLYVYFGGLLNG